LGGHQLVTHYRKLQAQTGDLIWQTEMAVSTE
jgi:hypothetical protein